MNLNLLKLLTSVFIIGLAIQFWNTQESTAAETQFPDINPAYAEEAGYLTSKQIIRGFPDGTFKPHEPVSRADAAVMIGRALGLSGVHAAHPFPDVPSNHYARGFIAEAAELGLIRGYTDGTFKPGQPLTRAEMSVILDRAFPDMYSGSIAEAGFYDVSTTNFARHSIRRIASAGISNGYPDGTFQPARNVTRIEMALFLARTMNEDYRVTYTPAAPPIAKTKTAGQTDQIITVAGTGGGNADIAYWKKTDGHWTRELMVKGFVGSNGVSSSKVEGDRKTPAGSFGMPFAFGTENPGTKMDFRQITNRSYWISNVNDPQYNTWQERSTSHSHDEHLIRYADQYKYAVAIDYNMENPVPGKGSAIFLHVSNGTPTLGCVSIPEQNMRFLMRELGPNAKIIIAPSGSGLLNY